MAKGSIKSLGRGMLVVLIANLIKMFLSVLINLIQPKYLSVDTYATIKTFTLYISMTGIFHLGYEDGTYLKFGGKARNEIDDKELSYNISTLRLFQFVVSIVMLCVAFFIDDNVLKIFALVLLPYNMTMHFRLLYQATGEFGLYARIMNGSSIILFILNIFLIFGIKTDYYVYYLMIQVLVYLTVWMLLERDVCKGISQKNGIINGSIKELITNIKSGFFVMIGNFSSIFLTSVDRWFVKGLLTTYDFAAYSFAVSMESFLTVAVSPFTVTLYNYFCNEKNVDKIKRIQNYVLIFSSILVFIAFPIKFILERWLRKYNESAKVVVLLFCAQMLFIIIKSVYVNLYKARKEQNRYFFKLLIVLGSGVLFNALCFYVVRAKEAMALGTLLSAMLWFVLCQFDFKELRFDKRHYAYLIIQSVSFLIIGNVLNSILGLVVYFLVTVLDVIIFVRQDLYDILKFLSSIMKGKIVD